MKTHKFKLKKLVRDKIVHLIEESGRKAISRVIEQDEYIFELKNKLTEEVHELFEAVDNRHKNEADFAICEELADVLEVITSLAGACGVDFVNVEKTATRKKEEKGDFSERIYIDYIEINEDDPQIEYYRARADKYPEDF